MHLLHEEKEFIRQCLNGDFSIERFSTAIRQHA